jgi:hypothetical protein
MNGIRFQSRSSYVTTDHDKGQGMRELEMFRTVSPWRERNDGAYVCRNCGCVKGTGHHPTCIEADSP